MRTKKNSTPFQSWTHARGARTTIRLSEIARDPVMAAFLASGEGDADQFSVPTGRGPILAGGVPA